MSERMTSAQFKAKLDDFKRRSEAGEDVGKEAMEFVLIMAGDIYDMFVSMEHNLKLIALFAQNADERSRN